VRLFYPFGCVFQYTFARDSHYFHTVMFILALSMVGDVFSPLFHSRSPYVCSPYLMCHSHVLCTAYIWLHHPECYKHRRVELCRLTFIGWADPPLDHPIRFPLMQVGLYFQGIRHTYRFRAFWHISCEYFSLDPRFFMNLSPSFTPFILVFSLIYTIYWVSGRPSMYPCNRF